MPNKHSEGYHASYYQRNKARITAAQKVRRDKQRAENPFVGNMRTTKCHAIKAGIPFDLDPLELKVPDVCPYLGEPLYWSDDGIHDWTPSVDRVVPEKGYVTDNVQVISFLANAMKNHATIDQLITFAENVLRLHKKS